MKSARSRKSSGMYTHRSAYGRQNSHWVETLSAEEVQNFRDVFKLFDKDKTDTINAAELGTAMRTIGLTPTDEEVKALIQEVDTTGNGEIDFEEFLVMMARSNSNSVMEKQTHDVFEQFDIDKDGWINSTDLRLALKQFHGRDISESDATTLIMEARSDENTENKLSYEEFVSFMCDSK